MASPLAPLSKEELSALTEVMGRLAGQLQGSEAVLDQVVDPPVIGSPIATAYSDGNRVEFDLAYLFVTAGEDHLRTMLWIAEGGRLPSFALYTVMRGAAEALARAWYLLAGTTADERRSRGFNIRLNSIVEQSKLLNPRPRRGTPELKPSPDDLRRAELERQDLRRRLRALEDQAAALGITAIRDRNGRAVGFGPAALPQKWETVADAMHEGEFAYGLVSGFGHSEPWALLRPERSQPTQNPAIRLSPSAVDLDWLLSILDRVLDVHDGVLARWVELAGHPADVWKPAAPRL